MAINLISDVMKMASPALINNIATALGVNPTLAQTVLTSAVPSIFSGVAAQAATPSGLTTLMNSLSQVKPNLASSLAAPMTGGANNPMIAAGTSMLTSVLGAGALSTIVSGITKSSGVSAAAGTSLVAMAGQMAMSTLASHTSGMDAAGLGKLLSAQAGNFNAAMPAGMSASMGKMASSTSAAAQSAATGGTNWLMVALPVLAIAAGLYYFVGKKADHDDMAKPAATTMAAPAATATAMAPTVMIDNVDVSKSLTTSVTGLTTALTGVKDAATATAAVTQITEAAKGIGAVSALAAKFTPEQKSAVAALISGSMPALNGVITQVEALPGVGDILKPVIGPVVDQLTALIK